MCRHLFEKVDAYDAGMNMIAIETSATILHPKQDAALNTKSNFKRHSSLGNYSHFSLVASYVY